MQSSFKPFGVRRSVPLLLPTLLLFASMAAAAWGRSTPEPPPSGIVIHLFGPHSITSNILPVVPSSATATHPAGAPAAGDVSSAGPGSAQASAAVPSADASNANDPTLGQALHQLFVVGDPDQKPGARIPLGRSADRPRAFNQ